MCFSCSFAKYTNVDAAERPPHPSAKTLYQKRYFKSSVFPLSKFAFIAIPKNLESSMSVMLHHNHNLRGESSEC